jgi:transcriptional regulator with XRE-family HTH domain
MNDLIKKKARSNEPNALSERIRECVRRSGLTAKDFASKTGVSPSSITKYLQKNTAPSIVVAQAIATAANVSLHWLATGTEDSPISDQTPTGFIGQLRARLEVVIDSVGGADVFAAALKFDKDEVKSWLITGLPTAEQFKAILHRFDCSADELLLGSDANRSWHLRNLDMNADPTCRPTDVLGGVPRAAYPPSEMLQIINIQNWILGYYQPGQYDFVKVDNTLMEPVLKKGDMVIVRKSEPYDTEGVFLFSTIPAISAADTQSKEPNQESIKFFARLRINSNKQFVLSWDNAQGIMVKERGFNPLQEKIVGKAVAKLGEM